MSTAEAAIRSSIKVERVTRKPTDLAPVDRTITWDGFFNARDLGGLPTTDGGSTTRSRIYRSATLDLVTPAGWNAAHAAGVRTVVSLLNDDEVGSNEASSVKGSRGMIRVRVPLDAVEDTELWEHIRAEGLDATPLYFLPMLERHPERAAQAVRAVAYAAPGGVLVHCGAGRDRTGLVSALLLTLAGATPDAIVADYLDSAAALPFLEAATGQPSQQHLVDQALRAHDHTTPSAMRHTLASLDIPDLLRRGGLDDHDLAAARARLRS